MWEDHTERLRAEQGTRGGRELGTRAPRSQLSSWVAWFHHRIYIYVIFIPIFLCILKTEVQLVYNVETTHSVSLKLLLCTNPYNYHQLKKRTFPAPSRLLQVLPEIITTLTTIIITTDQCSYFCTSYKWKLPAYTCLSGFSGSARF